MNLKKNLDRHLIMLAVLGVFGLLAAGSTINAYGKGMKAYQAGDYAKAKKIWASSSDVKSLNDADSIEAAWYLGEIYQKEGDEGAALEWKTKAYNRAVGDTYSAEKFRKEKSETYEIMLSDSLIQTALAKQKAEQAKRRFVGTWNLYACQYNGKRYDTSNLRTRPQKIVLNENGTGTIYWINAKDNDFNWSADGGSISFSGTTMTLGLNNQGYIVLNSIGIKYDLGLIYASYFFAK